MFSHVSVGTNNLSVAVTFYDAVLLPLGLRQRKVEPDGGPRAKCWIHGDLQLPRFYIYEPIDGKVAVPGNGVMVAFCAPSVTAVALSYLAAMDMGGTDGGEPGPRLRYGKGYFGAYLFDLDGNKIHIVHRGDLK